MNPKTKFITSILGMVIAVGAVSFWIYKDITKVEERRANDAPPLDLEKSNIKVETLPLKATLPDAPIPDLHKPIKFYNNLGAEFERLMTEKIEVSRRVLREDPTQFQHWVELGINYKRIDDFKSAEEMWRFAELMIPGNAVVIGNLANLYAYSLQDIPKADEYYIKTLEVAGGFTYLYFQLAEYYKNIKNDISQAIAAVELGVERNPNDLNLKALLDSLKSN